MGNRLRRPGAWRLALVTVLQFLEGLPDRQAADAVRSRLDWKYALSLERTNPGFDHTVLSEFRTRLVAGGAEERLLDLVLDQARTRSWLKTRGKQRTDSTHVLAAVRALSRLECVGETLRHALNVLAEVAPDWLRAQVQPEWVERYAHRVEEYRLPSSKTEREQYANQVGADGWQLLDAVDAASTPSWLRDLPAMQTLRRVWAQQYHARAMHAHRGRRVAPPARRTKSKMTPTIRSRTAAAGAPKRSWRPRTRCRARPTTQMRATARNVRPVGWAPSGLQVARDRDL